MARRGSVDDMSFGGSDFGEERGHDVMMANSDTTSGPDPALDYINGYRHGFNAGHLAGTPSAAPSTAPAPATTANGDADLGDYVHGYQAGWADGFRTGAEAPADVDMEDHGLTLQQLAQLPTTPIFAPVGLARPTNFVFPEGPAYGSCMEEGFDPVWLFRCDGLEARLDEAIKMRMEIRELLQSLSWYLPHSRADQNMVIGGKDGRLELIINKLWKMGCMESLTHNQHGTTRQLANWLLHVLATLLTELHRVRDAGEGRLRKQLQYDGFLGHAWMELETVQAQVFVHGVAIGAWLNAYE